MTRAKMIVIPMLLICLAVAMGFEIKDTTEEDRLPAGGWTVGFHLYQAEGFESIPVRVTGITSEKNKGLSGVELRNRSSKPVTAVRIGWYVSTESGPGTILAKGESPFLGLPATLQANESLRLSLPPVSLAKILKPVVKGNTLRGDFGVQVTVMEITYEDGSTWKFSQPANVARVELKYAHARALVCGTTCRWSSQSESFYCEQVQENVRCTVYPGACTVEACDPGGN